ncbi:hypothetical protein CDV31_016278 [Fusarium ambrosium]|uniref:Major facilitator superfamily (MFS) profile domain-containing protein n=1 Tax=Fusarium ambrosium TaxID=131363 RepID=A0A428SBV0_9HYPO|nr:hypothetical protein CDV31_016278 [Fusarium ambrosium]
MVLKWFKRPSLWIAIMTTTWGVVLLCTGFVQNYAGLLVCRVLLGVTEAGFFPGAILIVTNWYSWSEVGVRVALFYTSSALAGAFSGLLAYLIAKMDGVGGYEGWRWIFLLEGGVSTIIGLICPLIIIDTPALSKWLTEDEKRYLILRKEVEDGGREVQAKGHKITGKVLFATLTDWKIYLQAIIALSNTIPNYGFKFTMPQIMKNMGYTSANAQLLTIPPYVLGAISAYISARFADRYRWRMPFIVGPQFLVLIGFAITCAYSQDIKNRIGENYFAVSLACIGLYPIIPGANAWNSNNLAGPAKRAAGIGLLGTFASAGGLGGSFIYIETESPKYPTGFGMSLGMATAGIIAAFTLEFLLWRINKTNEKYTVEEVKMKYTDDELADMDYQTFSGRTAPPAELHEVFQQIKRLGTGQGILSPEDADAIRNTDLDVGGFKHMISEPVAAATYTSETRRDLGTLPSLEKLINDVWENAIRCERHDLPEAAWNCAVHYPLLQETLRCTQLRQANLSSQQVRLKADNITSINITKLYAPSTARLKHNKRVDFCLYFDPDEGSPLADAIYDKVKFNIHPSVNHTELPYLSRSPIAMGIETKKTGEGWRAALEQISIWASAHWKRLRELTEDTDKLPFLPAIIVQGHDWFFVAATQGRVLKGGNRETVIWSKAPIGGTEGLEGICQLVAVLQYLAKWSVETYWPWFCQAVLGQT